MHTSLKRLGEIEFLRKLLKVQSIWEIELVQLQLQLQQILYVSVAVGPHMNLPEAKVLQFQISVTLLMVRANYMFQRNCH